jgi:hypothetical protein
VGGTREGGAVLVPGVAELAQYEFGVLGDRVSGLRSLCSLHLIVVR